MQNIICLCKYSFPLNIRHLEIRKMIIIIIYHELGALCRLEVICTDGYAICTGKYLLNTWDSKMYLPSFRYAEVGSKFMKHETRQWIHGFPSMISRTVTWFGDVVRYIKDVREIWVPLNWYSSLGPVSIGCFFVAYVVQVLILTIPK